MKEKFIEFILDKTKSKLALVLIFIALLTQKYILFSLLFIYWIINDLIKGETYLLEPVRRAQNPILYWIIILVWVFFAYYSISTIYYFY